MRVLKEAYTEHVKAVVAPDYVTLEKLPIVHGQEPLHLSRTEAAELIEWLSHEMFRVLPEVIQLKKVEEVWQAPPPKNEAKKDECDYIPSPRSASQTVELKIGDPNLAARLGGGRTSAPGDGDAGVMDLGALAEKVGSIK